MDILSARSSAKRGSFDVVEPDQARLQDPEADGLLSCENAAVEALE